ncbi:MAG: CHRD domain-containing protein, partial [Sandaracinobacteroides sp.]
MRVSTLAIVSALLLPSAAQAATYVASLSGSQEVPAVVTTGTGFSKLVVSGNTLTVSVSFADLSGPLQAGHIHCCTTGPDQNVGVAIGFTVPNVATGMFDLMFNLASEATYTPGFLAGGTADMARDRLIAGFDSGNSYVNLHTTA